MGVALWKRADVRPAKIALPDHFPAPEPLCRYRIEVFGRGQAPWRNSPAEAMVDAIALDLAAWDESKREHYLAVPVEMRVRKLVDEQQAATGDRGAMAAVPGAF